MSYFFTESVGKLRCIERRENNIYDCLTYVKIVIFSRVFIWAKYSVQHLDKCVIYW